MGTAAIKKDASEDVSHSSEQTVKSLSERIRLLEAVTGNFPGGILLFDKELKLVLCNAQQMWLLDYPNTLFADGGPSLKQIFRFNAERGDYGPGNIDDLVNACMDLAARDRALVSERKRPDGRVLESDDCNNSLSHLNPLHGAKCPESCSPTMSWLKIFPLGLACLQLCLVGCEDQCSNYSAHRFNCEQIAKAKYNVHFSLPDHSELSLGKVDGLSNCARMASDYARSHSVPKQYVCCMITEASSCAETHR